MNGRLSTVSFLALVHNITVCWVGQYNDEIIENGLICNTSVDTLEFVSVISRHGSRTPIRTYPNDPYPFNNKSFWPFGPHELTLYGKKQLFLTGEKLRRRYAGFLPDQYYPNDTVVEYNDFRRDFTSAALILAGLYPPVGNEIWNPNLMWHPIPMNIRDYDICLLPFGNICPPFKSETFRLIGEMDRQAKTDNIKNQLLTNLSLHTGLNITKISDIFIIYDALHMQAENGFKLPLWTKYYYPEPLRTMYNSMVTKVFAGSDFSTRISAGPELKYISDMLNKKANGTFERNRKMYILAAHDCTLISLLSGLSNKGPQLEAMTSAYLVFELHFISPLHIVKVLYYRNSSVDNPDQINIAGCRSPCSLENFTKFVDGFHFSNWNERCQESNKNYKREKDT